MEIRKQEITLEYQDYIPHAPVSPQKLYQQSCSNDGPTVEAWKDTWIKNVKENHKRFGPFKEKGIGQILGQFRNKPVVVAGAGPSLKHNGHLLKEKGDIPLISCLHNFHFFEDLGVDVDYYVTLDAGEVTIEEVTEGGSKTEDEYWTITEKRTLLAFIGTSPRLIEKWRGKILFFNAPVPSAEYMQAVREIEPFHSYISTGGNVLGASLYIAKAVLQCNPVAYVGADFCFGYDRKFHAWNSKYDAKMGHVIKVTDVFGNKVPTWQSYYNFKTWFDFVATQVPGIWINSTEGGTMGAYLEGNIQAIQQMPLRAFLNMYTIWKDVEDQFKDPTTLQEKLLF